MSNSIDQIIDDIFEKWDIHPYEEDEDDIPNILWSTWYREDISRGMFKTHEDIKRSITDVFREQ